jgi:hypothetical protein
MSSRPTDSAFRRSRSALPAPSPSRSRCAPGSTGPAGRPARAGQPGLELALGLHLLLQRAQASRRAPMSASLPLSRLTLSCACGAARPAAGTCSAARAGVRRLVPARRPRRLLLCAARQPGQCRRLQALALGRPGARAGRARLARLLVDVAAVGGQHLDLLLHLRHGVALLVGTRPARRAPRLPPAAAARPAPRPGRPAPRPVRRPLRSARRCLQLGRGVGLGAGPLAFCAAGRPGAAAPAGGLRPRSGCALRAGSPPARPRPARPASGAARRWRRSAPGAACPAPVRRGAARPAALPARWRPRRWLAFTRCFFLRGVALLQEPQLVQLQRALVLQPR